MVIEAVVFDLDGTLVDTLGNIAESMNAALRSRGRGPFSAETYAPWIGEGVAEFAAHALGGGTAEDIASLVADYQAHNVTRVFECSPPFPGVLELLDALDARGLPLAVLSNKTHATAQELVNRVFPDRFRVVFGNQPSYAQKPDPAGAFALCKELGVAPSAAVLVGDTEIDIATARASGMRGLAATWGMRSREALVRAGPDALVDHPLDVLDHLGP